MNKSIAFVLLGCLLFSCSAPKLKTLTLKGSTNNDLEVLDWGGKGEAIIFLTGLGNSAHVYQSFAPKFTNNYHVYGITRRGFGQSERTQNGFHVDTLVNDIVKVMDQLQLKKAILVGHSIAGDELSSFARLYPDRLMATIYLDAAYSHAHIFDLFGNWPQLPLGADSLTVYASAENIVAYSKKHDGIETPIEEIRATNKFDKTGRLINDTSALASQAFTEIIKFAEPVSYKETQCPSLAIYAKRDNEQEMFRDYPLFDSSRKRQATEAITKWRTYYASETKNYRDNCAKGHILEIPNGHHYIYLSHPAETEAEIRKFLKSL